MAYLPETSLFQAVTQIETDEPVLGGPGGVSNRALQELTNRTRFLRDQLDAVEAALGDSALLAKILEIDGVGSGVDADQVRGLPADFSSLQEENGWQRLPGGVVIQWGRAQIDSAASSGPISIGLPIAFQNAVLSVSVCDLATPPISSNAHMISWARDGSTLTHLSFICVGNSGNWANSNVSWIAIGH